LEEYDKEAKFFPQQSKRQGINFVSNSFRQSFCNGMIFLKNIVDLKGHGEL
jgi:hypothetical protein